MAEKVSCLISETHDPWFNLATEDWIFRDMDPSQKILFLWRNKDTVVIGRNQNPWSECNLQMMNNDNILLARRHSGGGAVFQDLGNTNFTFLSSRRSHDKNRNFQIIINALKRFGIVAEVAGRNDILVDGKKISGSAYKETTGRAFHHGTLLVNVNLSKLANYLTPSKKKLISKGVQSVKARVTNLQEFHPTISHDTVSEAIINEFCETYNAKRNVEILNYDSLKSIPTLKSYYEMLKSNEWRFGETPQFQHNLEERFDWGTISVHKNVEKGYITDVKIYSDALNTEMIDLLMKHLSGTRYHRDMVSQSIAVVQAKLPEVEEQLQDFSDWIVNEIG